MNGVLGTIIIILIIAAVVVLAARSLWKNRKSACSCGGNCSQCCGFNQKNDM